MSGQDTGCARVFASFDGGEPSVRVISSDRVGPFAVVDLGSLELTSHSADYLRRIAAAFARAADALEGHCSDDTGRMADGSRVEREPAEAQRQAETALQGLI